MRALNSKADIFLVGSDQLYNPWVYNVSDKFTSLDWVQDNKKKIAYAASFGKDTLNCSEDLRAEMSYFLKKFDAFSVREKSGVEICNQALGIGATYVMDPVFLCNLEHYYTMAGMGKYRESPQIGYVCGYILDPNEEKQTILTDICDKLKLPYKIYTEYGIRRPFRLKIDYDNYTYNQQMRDMINCNFFVTDSFHGVCFSIILKKNFVVYANYARGYTRFESILSELGLMDRLIKNYTEFNERRNDLLKPINYTRVYNKLSPLVEFSRSWLKEKLETNIQKTLSDYDIIVGLLKKIWNVWKIRLIIIHPIRNCYWKESAS